MFVILLRFAENKHKAGPFMSAHNVWIQRGLADGVFLVVGSLQPQLGGAVVAHNTTRSELLARMEEDPFVAEGVVQAEVLELAPSKTDPRLAFLIE